MISPAAIGGTVITVELPSIALDQASTFAVRQELLYIRPPSTGTADVKLTDSNVKVHLELDRSIQSQPSLSTQVWRVFQYQYGFTDYRFWSTPPTGFANTTLRPSFQMWENAKFMDTGNILHNGCLLYTSDAADE